MQMIERLAEHPELIPAAAEWFGQKWGIPAEDYAASMQEGSAHPDAIPQWYVIRDGEEIAAGCGLIANDFHDRPDLTPNLCALYVEEPYRNQGIARRLLEFAQAETRRLGFERLYLITDHDQLYERCGWEYLGQVHETDGAEIRLYGIAV